MIRFTIINTRYYICLAYLNFKFKILYEYFVDFIFNFDYFIHGLLKL